MITTRMIRCHDCKDTQVVYVDTNNDVRIRCDTCKQSHSLSWYIDLTSQDWAQEEIRKHEQKSTRYQFFDSDGDPTKDLSNTIYEIEHYIYSRIKPFVENRMSPLELRALTERIMNMAHVTCLSFMQDTRKADRG